MYKPNKRKFYFKVYDNDDDSYFMYMEAEAYSEASAISALEKSFKSDMIICPIQEEESNSCKRMM